MNNKEFSKGLEERTKKFAVKIIGISSALPNTAEANVVRNQITKSGTSVGANYREANRSRSRADFKSRVKICESEASETQYWMEIITEIGWLKPEKIENHYIECSELLAIFASIGKSTGRKL